MKITRITKCGMSDCEYNFDETCHTVGINIGHHGECLTYSASKNKRGFKDAKAGIGACHAADCEFNIEHECQAPVINVVIQDHEADCEQYHPHRIPSVADISF